LKEQAQVPQFNGLAAILGLDRFLIVFLMPGHVFQNLARSIG